MPSRSGVTSPTRLERKIPASAVRDTGRTTKRIGAQSTSKYLPFTWPSTPSTSRRSA
jgi:hypothetical protein